MDGVVSSIQALSQNSADLQQLLQALKQQNAISQSNRQQLQAALQALDPSIHSLGCLFIFDAIAKNHRMSEGDIQFVQDVSMFLKTCNHAQIQLMPEMFCDLCKKLKEEVLKSICPRVGILPLHAAIKQLRPHAECLTPIHADFLQLCLLSKCYNAAAELLSEDIFEVEPQRTHSTPTDLYLYCYYGGMVCIGRKQYARALELFVQALSAPIGAGNAIIVAIYGKYVLTSLLHSGSLLPLPKFTSQKLRTLAESECRPYVELANACGAANMEKINKTVETHTAAYQHDGNLGLVQLLVQSMTQRAIARLTQTYLTLSLADIAAQVGLPSADVAEMTLLRMIGEGSIYARIDGHTRSVQFLDDPQTYNTAATAALINTQITNCINLSARMQKANEAVSCDRQFITKVTSKERNRFDIAGDFLGSEGLYQP